MSESQFLQSVEEVLARTEAAIDGAQIGADCSMSGLVLTVELEDGARVVINAQTPMRQLWFASRLGAMHFSFDGAHWRDLRSGAEYFETLRAVLAQLTGTDVVLGQA